MRVGAVSAAVFAVAVAVAAKAVVADKVAEMAASVARIFMVLLRTGMVSLADDAGCGTECFRFGRPRDHRPPFAAQGGMVTAQTVVRRIESVFGPSCHSIHPRFMFTPVVDYGCNQGRVI